MLFLNSNNPACRKLSNRTGQRLLAASMRELNVDRDTEPILNGFIHIIEYLKAPLNENINKQLIPDRTQQERLFNAIPTQINYLQA